MPMEFLHGRPSVRRNLKLIRLEIEALTASKRQVVRRKPITAVRVEADA
jgi:hypothetical protein